MFDLTSKSWKFNAGLTLLVAANVMLSACSSSRVSPDEMSQPEGAIEVTDTEVTPLPTPEPQIEQDSQVATSTLSGEVPYPQAPRKFKRTSKHKRVAHRGVVKKDVIESVKKEIAADFKKDRETLMASAATVSELPPMDPPSAELDAPAIIDPSLEAQASLVGSNNWVYVSVAGLLGLSLMALGVRARRKKTPRRLVLN